MANETLARRYATAVFGLAREHDAVEAVGEDLAAIDDAISSNDASQRFFLAPIIDRKEKEAVLTGAFSRAHTVALHTVLLLVRKRRERLLHELVRQYFVLEREARGEEPLTIESARELPDSEVRALVAPLERAYGKRFEITQRVDPALIGGVRLLMGDRVIDGSVAGRLQELARTLHGKN
ncbi:MAG: ATP synthase F1 subunit delta [Candidatus Eremiobacteraeota bacterium]|nr:ATP synthase F1 subunit delta [Candidatus Eremiobacteraeota bacterium]